MASSPGIRSHARDRLQEALEYPVAILTAPAGYGKSFALNEALANWDRRVVRHAPKANTGSLAAFVREIAEAVCDLAPAARLSFAGAWERATESASPPEHAARWLIAHLSDLEATIVLDQMHLVSGIAGVERFLSRLVDLSPDRLRWVFSLRGELDLPVPRWLADRKMSLPVEAQDLRFELREVVSAAERSGREIDSVRAHEILALTGGWPMGVMFALRSADGQPVRNEELGADSYGVLAERVFRDRTRREREFLLKTCLLPDLDAALCRAAGLADAPEILLAIGPDAGFIFANTGTALQYHDRFAGFLQNLLRSRGSVHFAGVLILAASALRDAGRISDALRLLTRHAVQSEIAVLLTRHGLAMMQTEDEEAVQAALSAFGQPDESWSAEMFALRAIFESRASRYDTSDAWFSLAMERVEDPEKRAQIAYCCGAEMLQRRRPEAVAVLEPHAHNAGLPAQLRVAMLSALGSAHVLSGHAGKAEGAISEAMRLAGSLNDTSLEVPLFVRAAYVALNTGHVGEAKTLASRAAALAEETGQFSMAFAAFSTLYAIAADEDVPQDCRQYLARLADNAAKSGNPRMQLYALAGLYELETECANAAGIASAHAGLQFFDVHYETIDTGDAILPAQAMQLTWSGRFSEACQLLSASADRQVDPDRVALRWAEIAVYAAAAGARENAKSALRSVRSALKGDSGTSVRTFRAQALAALALQLLGRHRCALGLIRWIEKSATSNRARAIARAIREVVYALDGRTAAPALESALNDLRSCDAGGLAQTLAAIPVSAKHRAPRPGADLTEYLEKDRAEFKNLLLELTTVPDERSVELELALTLFADRLAQVFAEKSTAQFESWMQAFLQQYKSVETLRTIVSTAPAAFDRVLAARAVRVNAETLSSLSGILTSVPLHTESNLLPATFDILDEIDAALNDFITRLDANDPLTAEHSRAVSSWCARLARKLGLSAQEAVFASRSGLIHDIGKLHTPSGVLNAPRSLTGEEWEIMRAHAAAGESIVRDVPALRHLRPAVRSHHERIDGKGYPDGLAGGRIPFIARLVAVADSFNAMIGRRPYRKPMPPQVALAELERHRGTQFDPEVLDAMIEVIKGS